MKHVLTLTLVWRLGLFLVAALATTFIGLKFPYPRFNELIDWGHHLPMFWSWGGFDGVHYITIARDGYIADSTQAFFPVFPSVMRIISAGLRVNELWAGLIVSNASLFLAIALFWKLLRLDLSTTRARNVIVLFLLFPTAFYLGAVYSESLFLLLTFGAFYAARTRRWILASVLGGMASATRPIGVFLFPALLFEWRGDQKEEGGRKSGRGKRGSIVALISLFLIPLGLGLYMNFLWKHFGDPLKFIHTQPTFGAGRSDKIVLLYQVFWRYAKMIATVQLDSLLFFRVVQEFFWSTMFLILGVLSFTKTRRSYATFAILAYVTPTLTGTFSSMPRYVLVMFPVFMVLGKWLEKRKKLGKIWLGLSAILLIIDVSLFLTGRWVA